MSRLVILIHYSSGTLANVVRKERKKVIHIGKEEIKIVELQAVESASIPWCISRLFGTHSL